MVLKANYINGETLSASAFNEVATEVNTNTTQLAAASSANTASTLVQRDASGNFSAGTVTASRLVSNVAQGTAPFTVTSSTVVANLNASSVAGYGPAQTAAANTVLARDPNANATARGFIPGFTTTVASATPVVLTCSAVASTTNQIQEFTGVATQTVRLPTTGVVAGQSWTIINNSTGAVTVQSSAAAAIGAALTTGTSAEFIALVAAPTTAAHWHRR